MDSTSSFYVLVGQLAGFHSRFIQRRSPGRHIAFCGLFPWLGYHTEWWALQPPSMEMTQIQQWGFLTHKAVGCQFCGHSSQTNWNISSHWHWISKDHILQICDQMFLLSLVDLLDCSAFGVNIINYWCVLLPLGLRDVSEMHVLT